jgi:hypothetical protein
MKGIKMISRKVRQKKDSFTPEQMAEVLFTSHGIEKALMMAEQETVATGSNGAPKPQWRIDFWVHVKNILKKKPQQKRVS